MKTENKNKVIQLLENSGINIDFRYMLQNEDFTTVEEIRDILENNSAFDIEVIYYSNAIKILAEYDNSLRDSLEIANDMGFELKNINSELLASLLMSQKAREEFAEIESELETLLEEIELDEIEDGIEKAED